MSERTTRRHLRRLVAVAIIILAAFGAAPASSSAPGPSAPATWPKVCYFRGSAYSPDIKGTEAYVIYPTSSILRGQYCQIGKASLRMQWDGNLVVYDASDRARWSTGTWVPGRVGDRATFQTDGNLVVYNSSGHPLWASNTCCASFRRMTVQADGNVVIYDTSNSSNAANWRAVWATNTL